MCIIHHYYNEGRVAARSTRLPGPGHWVHCLRWWNLFVLPAFRNLALEDVPIATCSLKNEYARIGEEGADTYPFISTFTLFPPLLGTLIGFLLRLYNKATDVPTVDIKFFPALYCGFFVNLGMITYNEAVVEASFPAVVMVKSCSVLSVILVAVCCSRVKDKKLWLGK